MSEPTPTSAAEPSTAAAPPYAPWAARRRPEPGAGAVPERVDEAVPTAAPVAGPGPEPAPGPDPVEPGPVEAGPVEPGPVEAGPVEPEPAGAGPVPLGVDRTPTGNADVDAALDRLADADELVTGGHLEVYEDAHRRMRAALEELDRNEGPPPPVPAHPSPYRPGNP